MASAERKQSAAVAESRPKLLTDRPLDVMYLAYFGIHLLASIGIDAQLTYPPYSERLFPQTLRKVLQDYLTKSKDPFLLAAAAKSPSHVWFRVLLASETLFQIPCFVIFISGLLHGEWRGYDDSSSDQTWLEVVLIGNVSSYLTWLNRLYR